MKKILGLALITTIIISLSSGCAKQAAEPAAAESPMLKDGTYTASGQIDAKGWTPEMTIKVSNGKIIDVEFDEIAAMRKSESIEYQKYFKAQTKNDLLSVYASIQNNLIKTQEPSKIDTVAGATKASANLKALVAEALKNAKDNTKYIDGEYTAKGSTDEKNWTPVITVSVKNGKITAVKYDEISSMVFRYKSQDTAYKLNFNKSAKIDLDSVYDGLKQSLIEKQTPAKIDAIAGATETSTSFVKLAEQIIEQAK